MNARMSRTAQTAWWPVLALLAPLLVAGCSHTNPGRSDSASAAPALPPAAASNAGPVDYAAVAAAKPPEALYAGQKTCPVTGSTLGSMGPAVPVNAGGTTIYVCCQACVARVQNDPASYLAKVEAERAGRPDTPFAGGGERKSGGGCCRH